MTKTNDLANLKCWVKVVLLYCLKIANISLKYKSLGKCIGGKMELLAENRRHWVNITEIL